MGENNTMPDLGPAAQQVRTLVSGITDDQLSSPSPCGTYTVGDLLDHFMGLTFAFKVAATKSTDEVYDGPPPSGPGNASAANLHPEWRRRLPAQLDEMAVAWRAPSAWTGVAEAGGVTLPAEVMGLVALNELVIHGWDVARATGQPFACDPRTTEVIFDYLSQSTEPADREGVFGPVVEVPPDAPLLDRAVGLSGRDPSWTA